MAEWNLVFLWTTRTTALHRYWKIYLEVMFFLFHLSCSDGLHDYKHPLMGSAMSICRIDRWPNWNWIRGTCWQLQWDKMADSKLRRALHALLFIASVVIGAAAHEHHRFSRVKQTIQVLLGISLTSIFTPAKTHALSATYFRWYLEWWTDEIAAAVFGSWSDNSFDYFSMQMKTALQEQYQHFMYVTSLCALVVTTVNLNFWFYFIASK